MKVLFLTNIPAPYRVEFFNELGKKCDLTVLYELENASDREDSWTSKRAERFNEIFLKGKKIGADSAICISVIKYLKDKSYDIIVVGGYSTPTGMLAIEYLKLTKRKFILNSDGGIIKNDNKIKLLFKSHFIRSATAWLSTGKATDEYLVNYGANKDNIYRYPLTSIRKYDILTEPILDNKKNEIRKRLDIREENIIISVGQFIYRKGYDVLIESIRELPKECGVYIIGGEPTEEYIMLKEKYKLSNLHFVDFKSKDELAEYYKASDLFVLPTREDIWGLVINEAMSYGLPIITTDKCIAGIELVKIDVNGYIIPSDSKDKITEKIKLIINNKDRLKKMAINNINKISEYTIEKMADIHINIFDKVNER